MFSTSLAERDAEPGIRASTADYYNRLAAELAADPKALERRMADQVAAMFGAPAPATGGAK